MATITTHICDNCSCETERLYWVTMRRASQYGRHEDTIKSIDLCEECSLLFLGNNEAMFPPGKKLEFKG